KTVWPLRSDHHVTVIGKQLKFTNEVLRQLTITVKDDPHALRFFGPFAQLIETGCTGGGKNMLHQ
ncbi:MAG: hypothetical protein ACOVOO_09765, partial [Flavobacteriales bacterium]